MHYQQRTLHLWFQSFRLETAAVNRHPAASTMSTDSHPLDFLGDCAMEGDELVVAAQLANASNDEMEALLASGGNP